MFYPSRLCDATWSTAGIKDSDVGAVHCASDAEIGWLSILYRYRIGRLTLSRTSPISDDLWFPQTLSGWHIGKIWISHTMLVVGDAAARSLARLSSKLNTFAISCSDMWTFSWNCWRHTSWRCHRCWSATAIRREENAYFAENLRFWRLFHNLW